MTILFSLLTALIDKLLRAIKITISGLYFITRGEFGDIYMPKVPSA